ncbi:hypothetical protein SRB5_64270 [Streptomyces sp. RB5]|uniref:Uncharacterized protein n=1 Tax=Streptomyces smaragdinus TaxID=2585196 RepID=A0A7K0CRZ4_9ACTN|nr:hypothetical protein [Streptomyces smaragdinus]MQY16229.1 hypothetical protein [Streptomyces smaragdinus]
MPVFGADGMVTRMWEGLEEIGWAGLKHNYGSAEDVPGLLHRCAGPSPEDAEEAADELHNLLYHQGGWICSAASAALPFLLRLAADARVRCRRTVLGLVASLAAESGRVADRLLDPGWPPAWEQVLPEVLDLLTDPDPGIRRSAADVVSDCDSPGHLLLPALLRCWQVERDLVNRLDLTLALGRAVTREPAGNRADEAGALLRSLLDSPEPQLRLAAVHALAPHDPGLAESRLEVVLDAIRAPSAELWQRSSSVAGGARGVQYWTAALYTSASPAFALGLLADHHDEEQRVGGLTQAGGLLAQWRSPAEVLLPAIADRLDDPVTEVRYRAVELLACLGPVAAAHADAVAGLLEDTAARNTRTGETVAEASLWALARMNDPRCVPALAERVRGVARSGFASASAHFGSGHSPHFPALPALHEVLTQVPEHAARLLPSIRDRLGKAPEVVGCKQLCDVLAAWGPAAKSAVPQLLDLLEDDERWTAAATALAGIGPAGNGGRELLLARSSAPDSGADAELAAWAYLRVGGEREPVLSVLGPAAVGGRFPHPSLRKLADLGSHAAPFADRIRPMVNDRDTWIRVEAAHALWAATGDTESTVPALLEAVRDLAEGTFFPVMLPALRYLARIGPAARPAADLLRDVAAGDRRLHYSGGWRAFTEDESVRVAIDELFAATA